MKSPSLVVLSLLALSLTTAQTAHAEDSGILNIPSASDSAVLSGKPTDASVVASAPGASATTATAEPVAKSPNLSFDPPTVPTQTTPTSVPDPPPSNASSPPAPSTAHADIFAGGSDSLVARTVGHAEGTRTADGNKTHAYYGHVDPGNGVWNLGSFSYQHGAKSPEEADEKQLKRLQGQADVIRQKADAHGMNLSLEEELNAIDLANQSPLAALSTPGYVEWLKQAHDRGLTGSDAVLWARTQSYWDPHLNRWNAPGLGNAEGSISHDQNRRQTAIARALDVYEQQVVAQKKEDEPPVKVANKPPSESIADRIIFQDLSSPRPKEVAQAGN